MAERGGEAARRLRALRDSQDEPASPALYQDCGRPADSHARQALAYADDARILRSNRVKVAPLQWHW